MGLPTVVEYLLTLMREDGTGFLCGQSATQFITRVIPPGTVISIDTFPVDGDYVNIVFLNQLNPGIVPNAFYATATYYGSKTSDGIVTASWLTDPVYTLVVVSNAMPARVLLENISPLTQFYSASVQFLSITTEADYYKVIDRLRFANFSDANRLADKLVASIMGVPPGSPPGIRPPVIGVG